MWLGRKKSKCSDLQSIYILFYLTTKFPCPISIFGSKPKWRNRWRHRNMSKWGGVRPSKSWTPRPPPRALAPLYKPRRLSRKTSHHSTGIWGYVFSWKSLRRSTVSEIFIQIFLISIMTIVSGYIVCTELKNVFVIFYTIIRFSFWRIKRQVWLL